MRTALSTLCRTPAPAAAGAPDALLDELRRLGASALVLDETLPEGLLRALGPALRRAGTSLALAALEHRGPARLCSIDASEREAATSGARRAIELGATLGAPVVVLALGAAEIGWEPESVARAFARAEWDPGAGLGARLGEARRAVAGRHLDGARFGLERLLGPAEREGLALAIGPRPALPALPTVDEARALLDDFRGAPLGAWHDSAAAHREAALGIGQPEAWLGQLGKSMLGVRAADACGLLAPLPPGLGEVDFAPLARLPLAAVTCAPGTAAPEIARALSLLGAL